MEGHFPTAKASIAPVNSEVAQAVVLQERYQALKPQIPLLYAAVVSNLVGFHLSTRGAHLWDLGLAIPIAALIVYRLVHWRRLSTHDLSSDAVASELRKNFIFAIILSLLFTAWTITVLVQGSRDQQHFAVLFASLAAIGSAVAMAAVPRAAMVPLLLIALPIAGWLILSKNLPFVVIGVSLICLIGVIHRMFLSRDQALMALLASRAQISEEREQARATAERHQLLGRATQDLVWDWDIARQMIQWNEALETRLGYARGDLKRTLQWCLKRVHPEDRTRVAAQVRRAIAENAPNFESEFRFARADGTYAIVYNRGCIIRDEDGRATRGVGAMQDLTPRLEAEHALSQSEALNRSIVQASTDGIHLVTRDGRVLLMNKAASASFEIDDPVAFEGTWLDLWPVKLRARMQRALAKALNGKVSRLSAQWTSSRGKVKWWDVVISPVENDRQRSKLVIVTRDVTDNKEAETSIRWGATHDALTRLPNRTLFQEKLADALSKAATAQRKACLLHLDLDGFKLVNDMHGHDAGDMLLRTFAERLDALLRPEDTVARLGGDEFAIILPRIETEEDLPKLAQSIFDRISQPIDYAGQNLDCRVSIGASVFPDHGLSPETLLKNADLALYSAKSVGRGGLAIYETDMRLEVQKRASMIAVARDAARDGRITPYYQPKIDIRSRSVVGFEALLRWRDPHGSLRTPQTIAAAFDDLEVASTISVHMVKSVIEDMRAWLDEGIEFGHVAINAAAAEFRYNNLAERILDELSRADVPTSRLQLEITEQVVLGRTAANVQRALNLLHEHDVTIALDDFGTGYAALSHLKQFPVDQLKIDQSFVRDLAKPVDAAIVEAIIKLAQTLDIKTVAEGVETRTQLEQLAQLGCDFAQGHLFWRAAPAARVGEILNSAHAGQCFEDEAVTDAA